MIDTMRPIYDESWFCARLCKGEVMDKVEGLPLSPDLIRSWIPEVLRHSGKPMKREGADSRRSTPATYLLADCRARRSTPNSSSGGHWETLGKAVLWKAPGTATGV